MKGVQIAPKTRLCDFQTSRTESTVLCLTCNKYRAATLRQQLFKHYIQNAKKQLQKNYSSPNNTSVTIKYI